jgi:hypothetical protein
VSGPSSFPLWGLSRVRGRPCLAGWQTGHGGQKLLTVECESATLEAKVLGQQPQQRARGGGRDCSSAADESRLFSPSSVSPCSFSSLHGSRHQPRLSGGLDARFTPDMPCRTVTNGDKPACVGWRVTPWCVSGLPPRVSSSWHSTLCNCVSSNQEPHVQPKASRLILPSSCGCDTDKRSWCGLTLVREFSKLSCWLVHDAAADLVDRQKNGWLAG